MKRRLGSRGRAVRAVSCTHFRRNPRAMIRRSPTRIEMRLDDLQVYEEIRKAHESKKDPEKKASSSMNPPMWGGKIPQNEIQERIGYVPQHSSTHNRTT
ncbi:anaphase-promoting complex subunit CDC26-like [Monomorium pharaonis]|uniref:anaphase-promoting complex subunit CDC26-like n=1 Tax=Monomorium pharaonis TaxID=307658 RepID=UPI001745C869|nr:anaphase-promoting complex subunit CDC26-like [Monomorium pharaonis]